MTDARTPVTIALGALAAGGLLVAAWALLRAPQDEPIEYLGYTYYVDQERLGWCASSPLLGARGTRVCAKTRAEAVTKIRRAIEREWLRDKREIARLRASRR